MHPSLIVALGMFGSASFTTALIGSKDGMLQIKLGNPIDRTQDAVFGFDVPFGEVEMPFFRALRFQGWIVKSDQRFGYFAYRPDSEQRANAA